MLDARSAKFRTTSWSLVLAAARTSTTDSGRALATLCELYWHPVYGFIRGRGHSLDEAQDLTQAFFARLIEKNYLASADRERGKFRSFLLSAVKHFLANEWDRTHALKRGAFQTAISIDLVEAEELYTSTLTDRRTPEDLFERAWGLTVLRHAFANLRAQYAESGKLKEFEYLSPFLTAEGDSCSYVDTASQLGTTAGALRVAAHRMRRRFRDLLRAEIAKTLFDENTIEDELRFLRLTLANK
jgi:RNA polymerase sigma-70 factor (ECF subfamily)